MKDYLGIFALVVVIIFAGWFMASNNSPDLAGWGGDDTYLTSTPTQATTTITTTIKLLIAVNTARDNFTFIANQDVYIWMANATTTSMTNGGGVNSSGIFVSSGTEWNMKDYGVIWPGKIYATASSTAGVVSYIDYSK
jgi:hypothetical protein